MNSCPAEDQRRLIAGQCPICGRAIPLQVSRGLVPTEARVESQCVPNEVCGGQNVTPFFSCRSIFHALLSFRAGETGSFETSMSRDSVSRQL
jgi:hypothetical protein